MRNSIVNPTTTATGMVTIQFLIVIAWRKSIIPIRNRTREHWRRSGNVLKILSTCQLIRAWYRIWCTAYISRGVSSEKDWCSRSHCSEIVPTNTVVKLRTKLMNQSVLTRRDEESGENSGWTGDGREELEPSGLSRCVAIRESREITVSSGFGWRFLYDSTMNVVTTAEKRPAYRLQCPRMIEC